MLNRNPPRSGWLLPVQMLQAPEEKHEQQKPTAPVTPGRADLVLQLASPSCPLHWAATPNRVRGTRSSLLSCSSFYLPVAILYSASLHPTLKKEQVEEISPFSRTQKPNLL